MILQNSPMQQQSFSHVELVPLVPRSLAAHSCTCNTIHTVKQLAVSSLASQTLSATFSSVEKEPHEAGTSVLPCHLHSSTLDGAYGESVTSHDPQLQAQRTKVMDGALYCRSWIKVKGRVVRIN